MTLLQHFITSYPQHYAKHKLRNIDYSEGDSEVLRPVGLHGVHAASMIVKFGVKSTDPHQLSPLRRRGRMWFPKLKKILFKNSI